MYCMRCGVKLGDSEKNCPLCGTVAFHPNIMRPEGELLYPEDAIKLPGVKPRSALIIITTAFLLPILITLLCDWQINARITWSGYVLGALVLAYVCFVLPFWFLKPNPVIFVPVSLFTVGLYLLYINYSVDGNWFLSFAFPTVMVVGGTVTAVTTLLRYVRGGRLYIFGGAFMALGLYMPIMEYLLNITFDREKYIGWSFYPLISLFLIGLMLLFLAIWKPARETMERKFFI